ncbi:MAG TPA: TRAP transporter large permease [Hyphomicrobiaceae bacterium]|nr:TRAP transporter large permease [Hyphomicrobiaceae bacterium]
MTDLQIGLGLIAGMVVLIMLGLQIGVSLLLLSFVGVWMIKGNPLVAYKLVALSSYSGINDYLFATIPLFVLMGLLVSISDVGKDTFHVAEALLRRVRGGLAMATVAANAVFAAVTGISIASAAVFTKVAVPEMIRHGYQPKWAVGTVAGSSILGMLIPPSLLMIIYGVLAEQSIGKLFIAGALPGLLIALGFVAVIWWTATFRPQSMFVDPVAAAAPVTVEESTGSLLLKLVPIATLVLIVLGGLYGGFFTPTEAGGMGAFGAFLIAIARRRLDRHKLWRVLKETGHVSVGILFLLIAAGLYSKVLAMAGVPNAISDLVGELGLGKWGFVFLYVLILLGLGCILDSSSILLIMVPIAAPIAQSFGMDLIHFGVITVIAVECGLLTPPFGISVFTVKATLGDSNIRLETIFAGAMPYFLVMLAALALVAVVPWFSLALIR